MKVCIFGAGAIGGFIGARLHAAGTEVCLVARGPHLQAICKSGLVLESAGGTIRATPPASDSPADFGPQDAVLLTVKGNGLAAAAAALDPLLGPDTMVVTTGNGLPWWYFHGLPAPYGGRSLRNAEPIGGHAPAIDFNRLIGAIVFASAEVTAPGHVRHQAGRRLVLGEICGGETSRLTRLAECLEGADFEAVVHPRIREALWVKLWLNLSFNPVSALTHGTLVDIAENTETRTVVRTMMQEAQRVAEAIGVSFPIDPDTRIEQARNVGAHKTSMLQDLERGRPLEIDPILGTVQEIARLVAVETPTIDIIAALVRQRGQLAGLYEPT